MKFTSLLKKAIMALTGLAMAGFLVTHLFGNLMLFSGYEKYNAYAKVLEDNPLFLIPAEIGLLAVFILHIYLAYRLTVENRAARGQGYAEIQTNGESSFASRHMWATGWIIFFFVVIHVYMFKFGARPGAAGLWGLVIQEFRKPSVVIFYVVSMLAMGIHLSHAIGSSLQSLGLRDSGGRPRLGGASAAIGWGLAIGFAMLPLWVILFDPKM